MTMTMTKTLYQGIVFPPTTAAQLSKLSINLPFVDLRSPNYASALILLSFSRCFSKLIVLHLSTVYFFTQCTMWVKKKQAWKPRSYTSLNLWRLKYRVRVQLSFPKNPPNAFLTRVRQTWQIFSVVVAVANWLSDYLSSNRTMTPLSSAFLWSSWFKVWD